MVHDLRPTSGTDSDALAVARCGTAVSSGDGAPVLVGSARVMVVISVVGVSSCAVWKEPLTSWRDVKLPPQTNKQTNNPVLLPEQAGPMGEPLQAGKEEPK